MKSKKIYTKLIILVLILTFGVFLYKYLVNYYTNNSISSIIPFKRKLNFDVVKSSESDNDIVKEYFMGAMTAKEFNDILYKSDSYINKTGDYETIDYNFEKKMHYDDLENLYINMNNSDICNVQVIGSSVDNRNIYGIEVGKGDRVLFLDANIHAAEVGGTLILTRFLSELINKYESGDEDVVKALNNVKIAVIPSINPDGYEIYNYGVESLRNKELWVYVNKDKIDFENIKSNANGVDLNRNFPTQNSGLYYTNKEFSKGVSLDKTFAPLTYFNGYSVGSEPETRAVMYFMIKHYRNTYAYINVHSQGRVIYAGKPNLSNEFNTETQKFGKYISSYTTYKLHPVSKERVGEGSDGSATDFMSELANGFAFSTTTGRLTCDKYVNNSCEFIYKYPVVTIETLKVWSDNPLYFKKEYYNFGLRKLFFSLLSY